MKINEIKPAEIFAVDNIPYMRIVTEYTDEGDNLANAVNLQTGELIWIDKNTEINI